MPKSILCAASFLVLLASAQGATIVVPTDAPTIQAAINAAAAGDIVLVKPGTYVECIKFGGKAITVRSEWGPAMTVINGKKLNSVVRFENGEGGASVLAGFTITNGKAPAGG